MNRRRFLIALAVVAPLVVLFFAAKVVASWRPVKVGPLADSVRQGQMPTVVASEDAVLAGDPFQHRIYFDLKRGLGSLPQAAGFTRDGAAYWRIQRGAVPSLVVGRGNSLEEYPLPAKLADELFGAAPSFAQVAEQSERVGFFYDGHYLRWNRQTTTLERDVRCAGNPYWLNAALARDGEAIINTEAKRILFFSTRTGRLIRSLPVLYPNASSRQASQISNYGSYALYEERTTGTIERAIDVWDTRSGRKLWSFAKTNGTGDPTTFSPDETLLAQAQSKRRLWEIYDLKSGALLHTLPLLPVTSAAAFSPDGATLYSVANGVLYRQRVR